MTGPPTPPPTSAIEIEDAARASLPPAQPPPAQPEGEETPPVAPPTTEPAPQDSLPQPSPQPVQQKTSYELLFPSVAELARSGNITELIAFAERADLSAESDKDPTRVFIVAPLVLAYMITGEFTLARHVLLRLPGSLQAIPLIQGLFGLLAAVSERKYALVYPRVEEVQKLVRPSALPVEAVALVLTGMMAAFLNAFRKRTFDLLARAYTSIQLQRAQVCLGLTAEQVVDVAVPNGWEFHDTRSILTPPKQSHGSARVAVPTPSTLGALTLVADSVANLEG